MKELDEKTRSTIRDLKDLYFEERYEIEKHYKLMDVVNKQWFLTIKGLIHYDEIDKIFSSEKELQENLIKDYLVEAFGKDIELISFEDDKLLRLITFKFNKETYHLYIPVLQNLTEENFHDYDEGKMKLSKVNSDGSLEYLETTYVEQEFLNWLGKYNEEDDFEETIC